MVRQGVTDMLQFSGRGFFSGDRFPQILEGICSPKEVKKPIVMGSPNRMLQHSSPFSPSNARILIEILLWASHAQTQGLGWGAQPMLPLSWSLSLSQEDSYHMTLLVAH